MLRHGLRSTAAILIASAMLALVAASPVAASGGSKSGSTTCGGTREVIVQSQASVYISHNWQDGHVQYFYNPYRTLKTSYTGYQSTWWVVAYDFEITSWGGSCVQ